MLANAECANRYTKSRIYENYWLDHHSIRIPWLNFLTAQSIPEETDVIDCPKRNHTVSDYCSSSEDDCYVVLEVQRSRSITIEQELNFAQINEDVHHVENDQLVQSMIIETPSKENTVEYQSKQIIINEEYPKVTQILSHNDDPPKIDEISIVTSEQQSLNHRWSITSLDSIENDSQLTNPPSYLSNPIQIQRETTTIAFDRVYKEKSDIENQSILPFYLNNQPNNLSKPSSFLRSIKKRTRPLKSEYYLSNNEIQTNEPLLLQMKYLDGRPTLTDLNALESFQKSQLSINPISSRLDSSKQDLSYGKRLLNRVQTFFKSTSIEQSKPWQQKTIFELLNERKTKINRC